MNASISNNNTGKYWPRFGHLAVEMGFITKIQLQEALRYQLEQNLSVGEHRLIGRILFDNNWMTSDQIEQVMNALLQRVRNEEMRRDSNVDSGLNPVKLMENCNGQR